MNQELFQRDYPGIQTILNDIVYPMFCFCNKFVYYIAILGFQKNIIVFLDGCLLLCIVLLYDDEYNATLPCYCDNILRNSIYRKKKVFQIYLLCRRCVTFPYQCTDRSCVCGV